MDGLRFCKDCRHFQPATDKVQAQCAHPQNVTWDLVTGNQRRERLPHAMRENTGPCARPAALFEPREN